ncbi:hypothetical protein RhiirA1_477001 [Rhizophagus irregularis]|uniref:Uncharacterized protein n=1 Tax=Rhizophagus irregularis TaxID=588596 RepID=A0A2I1F0W7_9GLOM|nr:hypothetical protein RhiirA1_477001 [Rhizophagus irregularis]PKY28004.1 hypothetical protein RhiirB3_443959 [Rhizophagus irregularis]
MGSAMRLAKEVQTFKEKLKHVFFSYKNLKEMLTKYGINGNVTYKFENDDEELVQCIKKVKHKLENMETMLANSNKVMRCEKTPLTYKIGHP